MVIIFCSPHPVGIVTNLSGLVNACPCMSPVVNTLTGSQKGPMSLWPLNHEIHQSAVLKASLVQINLLALSQDYRIFASFVLYIFIHVLLIHKIINPQLSKYWPSYVFQKLLRLLRTLQRFYYWYSIGRDLCKTFYRKKDSLRKLFTQCNYFSSSLAKVSIPFPPLPLLDLGKYLNTHLVANIAHVTKAGNGVTGDVLIWMYMSTEHMFCIWQVIDHLYTIQYLNIWCRWYQPQNNRVFKKHTYKYAKGELGRKGMGALASQDYHFQGASSLQDSI